MIGFGTDGIRGIVGSELDYDLAFRCGNSLGRLGKNLIIGRDTRPSGQMLTHAFCLGAILAGANITDVGQVSTPCISYLTSTLCKDFGVVISASHNPPEYNGIKVFNNLGKKLSDSGEAQITSQLNSCKLSYNNIGLYTFKPSLKNCYINYITKNINLTGLTVCVDCSNGATKTIAKTVFKKLGAKAYFTGMGSGKKINQNCGATCTSNISRFTASKRADIGFAFDGDGDRIMVADKFGKIYDGDNILYGLTKTTQAETVVGTLYSNLGLEKALNQQNINLVRADVGDKWVASTMDKLGAKLGGEQSGHIILPNILATGDGLLVAITLCNILKETKSVKKLLDFKRYPQVIKNVQVKDKKIISSPVIKKEVDALSANLSGRIIIRASGTEQKVRVMVECDKLGLATKVANKLENLIIKEDNLCAE